MKKIALICGAGDNVAHFRKDLIRRLILEGYDVTVISGDENRADEIISLGVKLVFCKVTNTGLNLFKDIKYKRALIKTLKSVGPETVFTFVTKPNIWGSRAAKKCRIENIFCMVEGMGRVYANNSFKNTILRFVINKLYKRSCKIARKVFFLNKDDPSYFINKKIIKPEKAVVLNGIGINTEVFPQKPMPENDMFLLIARLFYEKGIIEFCKAAEIVKKKYPEARFCILGAEDVIKADDLKKYASVEYLGTAKNVLPFYEQCSVYVLPSKYGEGLPRTILEAMSAGRPIITTDNVGCKETVENGINGFLVPVNDVDALAEKMELLISNKELRNKMADESRKLAESKFDERIINGIILTAINNGSGLSGRGIGDER